jgi:hypothetical protein
MEVAWTDRFGAFVDDQDELDAFFGMCLLDKAPAELERVRVGFEQLAEAVEHARLNRTR